MTIRSQCAFLLTTFCVPALAQQSEISITLAGQSMIRSDIRVSAPDAMSTITSLLKGDVNFTNFEGTVAKAGQPNENVPFQGSGFLAPPAAIDALKALGFNLLSLSNNHSADLKVPGIQNTLEQVNRLNLAHAGIGNRVQEAAAPGLLRTPKGTVALVAMASGEVAKDGSSTANRPGVDELRVEAGNKPNEEDAQRILESIRDAGKRADLVIVYQHNHIYDKPFGPMMQEELPERLVPPDWIRKWTHAEVEAGADIVVLHGAPLVQGVEIYHNRPIFYDLGNFIFQLVPTLTALDEPIIWESVVASAKFQGKRLQSVSFQPITLNKIGKGQADTQDPRANNQFLATRGLPTPATGEKARYILERLADSCRPFGTTIEVKGAIAEIHPKGEN
jgi:poly-gamma-glutamate capsule biosynthesis protein CapA/YwtB (metallophosphatase superfamily)